MFKCRVNIALYVMVAIAIGILILITNWSVANAFLDLIVLNSTDWLTVICCSMAPMIVIEIYKKIK